jgi:hypothetical protein
MLLQPNGDVLTSVRGPAPAVIVPRAFCDCDYLVRPLAEIERRIVESAIILCGGNVSLCAEKVNSKI